MESFMHPLLRPAAALAGALLATAAFADFRAEYVSAKGEEDRDRPALTRIELSGPHLRMDAGRSSFLFDAAAGRFLILLHDKRQYLDVQKLAETAGAAMARANAALANLPPEQRAMIEQRMGHALPKSGAAEMDLRYTATGASARVAGLSCQVYRVEFDGRHTGDACLADLADTGIAAADRAALQQCFERLQALSEKISAGMVKSPIRALPAGKFPVRMTHYDEEDGSVSSVAELKALATAPLDAREFAVPADYTEQALPGLARGH
jgi:hypothetical protein